MIKTLIFLFSVSVLFHAQQAKAYVGLCCAKCGGNMPLNIIGAGVPETHEFRFKFSPMTMRMGGLRDGASSVSFDSLLGSQSANTAGSGMNGANMQIAGMDMGGENISSNGKFMAAPQSMDMNMLNFAVGYSFTDDFFAGLMFMYKDYSMPMKFGQSMASMTGQADFTMKSSGMADTMLMTKYRLYTDDPLAPTSQASLFFGLSLPTGSINEKNESHPVKARRQELLPYSMQLGSGTFDPMLGLVYQGSASPWWWGANLIYTARIFDNARDYNLGDEIRADLYAMYQVRYNFVAQLQLNARSWGEIEGEMDVAASGASGRIVAGDPGSGYMTPLWSADNYGGQSLSVTAGVQWQPFALHILDLSVGIPVYQRLNGPQLQEDYRVMVTWYAEVPTVASVRSKNSKSRNKSRLGF